MYGLYLISLPKFINATMKNLFFVLLALIVLPDSNAQISKAQKIPVKHFKNLYQLNDSVYRSEQPSKKEFGRLKELGIKTILNLRRLKSDDKKAKGTKLHLEHLRLKTTEVDEKDIIDALRIIKNAEKPILVHCWHGSDRTGVVTAAYRILFEDWPKEKAIAEFRQPEFGYHENWYPNLIEILKGLDVARIKAQLGL